jgi:hypothetical protein
VYVVVEEIEARSEIVVVLLVEFKDRRNSTLQVNHAGRSCVNWIWKRGVKMREIADLKVSDSPERGNFRSGAASSETSKTSLMYAHTRARARARTDTHHARIA